MQEKRKNKRLNTCGETFLAKSDGQKTGVKLVDISLGGMRVLMNECLDPGTILLGELNILPRCAPFYIKGEVSWARPCEDKNSSYGFEIGIKFNKINTIPI
jgi:hypothetical protein